MLINHFEWDSSEETPMSQAIDKYWNYGLVMQKKCLEGYPEYNPMDRTLDFEARLDKLHTLYNVYCPTGQAYEVFSQLYSTVREAYRIKESGDNFPKVLSFSLIGESGSGKTTMIKRILNLCPQVIYHKIGDREFHQVVYLYVETPHDGSIKGLCLSIINQIDNVLGTHLYNSTMVQRASVDSLIIILTEVFKTHNVGLLVVDEIQNLCSGKSSTGIKMLKFLLQFVNAYNIAIALVGTPLIRDYFMSEDWMARRTYGEILQPSEEGQEFDKLLDTLWRYQYTQHPATCTTRMRSILYTFSEGMPYRLINLIYNVEKQAILDGIEIISESAIKQVAGELGYVNKSLPFMALPKRRTVNKQTHEAKYDSADIRALSVKFTQKSKGLFEELVKRKVIVDLI